MVAASVFTQKRFKGTVQEDVRGHSPDRVDRENKVIRGVRITGLISENGRIYTPESLREAISLYEGCTVRTNHPKSPHDQRSTLETFGWLSEVHVGHDGALYGDLHYLKANSLSEAVCEAAERNPKLFGLSHNADAEWYKDNEGRKVITKITAVRSVDIVDGPATNSSLFEGKRITTRVNIGSYMEALTLNAKLERKKRKALMEEMDANPMPEGDMDVPAEDVSPEDQLTAGFRASILSIFDGEGTAADKAKKITQYLKSHEKLLGGGGEPDAAAPVVEDDKEKEETPVKEACEEDKDKKEMKESKTAKTPVAGSSTLTEARYKKLCKWIGVKDSPTMMETALALGDEDKAVAYLEQVKELSGNVNQGGQQPLYPSGARSIPAGSVKSGSSNGTAPWFTAN